MEFADWLSLHELFDVQNMDTSNVEIYPLGHGITRALMMGDEEVRISLAPVHIRLGPLRFNNIWDVGFDRNGSWALAKSTTQSPFAVYAEVIRTIKKVTETEEVDGFQFVAYDPRTRPIYDKLIQRFLPDFVRVDPKVVIRRDVLERALAGLEPHERKKVNREIDLGQDLYANILKRSTVRPLPGTR